MLEIWDERLAELSCQIYNYRKKYIQKIQEIIGDIHNLITNCGQSPEKIEINFISSGKSKNEFYEKLEKSRKIDIQKGFTSTGIHRDDFEVFIDNKKVNIYGSQEQQRILEQADRLMEQKREEEEMILQRAEEIREQRRIEQEERILEQEMQQIDYEEEQQHLQDNY